MVRQYLAMAWVAAGSVLAWYPGVANAGGTPPPSRADRSGWSGESGTASYYGSAHHGRIAADGSRFDQNGLTAAHPWLPFGTRVRVTLLGSERSVVVGITDRLGSSRRIVDLSLAAAHRLGMVRRGIAAVSLTPA
jgi:rare lipoprotein A